jgi:hypothetical protein
MTERSKAEGDGVHRLVDMVVEEVSLVDRAANKHRFLIVKRNDAMDDEQDKTEKLDPEPELTTDASVQEAAFALSDSSPLGAALAALESLTAIVELLGSLGADSTDTRLAALAQQLRSTAEQILERTGFSEPSATDAASTEVTANAKSTEAPKEPSGFSADVTAAKEALKRLAELASAALPVATNKQATPDAAPGLTESLTKLTESFRQLSDTVKEQQQRLGRVEKQFGLPNSAAPAERVSKAADVDVGWPLDLNKPKDRENVDKAVSFHDL